MTLGKTPIPDIWAWVSELGRYKPRHADSAMGKLLWRDPAPLIDPRNRLVVIFSPKSACSNVVLWFFHHLGHVTAARDYHPFPHRYRTEVYYHSELYQDAYRDDFMTYRVIRVVRDPFQRAASAYRHLVGRATAGLGRTMKMSAIARKGLSFAGYIDFLEKLDLTSCNPHFAVQRHPVEEVLPVTHLINISTEDLYARFKAIETDAGLPHTDLQSSAWVGHVDRRNRPERVLYGQDLYRTPLFPAQAKTGPWPRYDDLLTPDARSRLAKLYAVDIETYKIPGS